MAETPETTPIDPAGPPPSPPLRVFRDAFSENRGAIGGLAVVTLTLLLAILADCLSPNSLPGRRDHPDEGPCLGRAQTGALVPVVAVLSPSLANTNEAASIVYLSRTVRLVRLVRLVRAAACAMRWSQKCAGHDQWLRLAQPLCGRLDALPGRVAGA